MNTSMGPTLLRAAGFVPILLVAVLACDRNTPAPKTALPESAASPEPTKNPAPSDAPAQSAKKTGAPVFDESFLRDEPKLYSQFREEVVIRYYFKDRRGGFFLDVGAAEWKLESTTYYLEHELGWSGIAIDARPELAKEYAENRPETRFFNYLVTDHSGESEKFYLAGRLSSGDKEHLKKFGIDDPHPAEIEVPSITLNDLLSREEVDHIDFMNMDIEGFEPPALAGFDIERYAPDLVCIEAAPGTRAPIMKYFTDHGYRRMDEFFPYDNVNWYFERNKP